MTRCAALILAGGAGSRLGADIPKQYLLLQGVPILRHTLNIFLDHPDIEIIKVVIGADDRPFYEKAIGDLALNPPVIGGASRQDSARIGLEAMVKDDPDYVLIHDAARPFVHPMIIDRVLAALKSSPAAIPGIAVFDTLKSSTGVPPVVNDTLARANLWRAQTPQGFLYSNILNAYRSYKGPNLTDDSAIAEFAGLPVTLVAGREDNFKITTADDMRRAEYMTQNTIGDFRVGNGFDVHAFGDGNHVVLCGVRIDHTQGLIGHSDADVAMHAVTDALLGAISGGDIGTHFPPSEKRWKDATSSVFLKHAADMVSKRGGIISNVDVTIICERPKVAPHRNAMQISLAQILTINSDRVSVKATTTEKMGSTGRGECIAAQASAAVRFG